LADSVPVLMRHLPQHKPWMIALSLIASLVIIAICGLGSYLLVKDDSTVVGANPSASPTVVKRDINDRKTDPAALTVADVFPATDVAAADPSVPPYKRLGNAQLAKDCRVGATGEVGKLFQKLACNQVIRATLSSPDGGYLVTAGVFNLRDHAAALEAHEVIPRLVDDGKGRLSGYISGSATRVMGRAPTQLAWDAQGHFLIYAVIARADGKEFDENDPNVRVIVYDIVEKYLRDRVIVEWSIERGTPGPTGSASPSPSAGG
jgi:hypothetical protein